MTTLAEDILSYWENGYWSRGRVLSVSAESEDISNEEYVILEDLTYEDEFSEGEGEEATGLGKGPTDYVPQVACDYRSGEDRRDGGIGCRRIVARRLEDPLPLFDRVQEPREMDSDISGDGTSFGAFSLGASSFPEDEQEESLDSDERGYLLGRVF